MSTSNNIFNLVIFLIITSNFIKLLDLIDSQLIAWMIMLLQSCAFCTSSPKSAFNGRIHGTSRESEAMEKDSYLHTDDSIDEEQHCYEETNVR